MMFKKALRNLCFSFIAFFNDEIYFFALGTWMGMFDSVRIDTTSGAARAAYTLH